jgi:hypothetical protein
MRRNHMPGFGRGAVLPVVLVATMATAARAQKQCEIDENTPGQVARAVLQLQLAQSASKPEDAAPKLRDAVKFLSEVPPGRNPVGVNYEMGRALVLWMAQPNIGFTPKRGCPRTRAVVLFLSRISKRSGIPRDSGILLARWHAIRDTWSAIRGTWGRETGH